MTQTAQPPKAELSNPLVPVDKTVESKQPAQSVPNPPPPHPTDDTASKSVQAVSGKLKKANGNSLVEVLKNQGILTEEQVEYVKLQELQAGSSEEDILLQGKLVSEKDIARAKSILYNIPFVDIQQEPISPEALALLPQSVASRFSVLPVSVDKSKKQLSLAMADPLDLTAIEFVETKTGMKVHPMVAVPSQVKQMINDRYAEGLAEEVTEALKETEPQAGVKTVDLARLSEVIKEAPIAKIVKELLEFAIRSRASDIHIEPLEGSTRIRYRIDGILQEKFTMPKQFHEALVSRVKILAGMKIDEKRVPQDGRFNFKAGEDEVDLRVSTLPTIFGEKIVMRLLKKSGGVPDLPELGLRGKALKNLEDAILRPHGIIIICGPTGSGKTTTLYSILTRISTPKVNVITLEDPVEYQIPGVNQVQVNPAAGLTFASGLRAFLRQDPNIIMVGEIRDSETAELATQAALTGHLVLATLHTNNAAGVLPRLLDMGVEPFLIASTMTAVVAQRIVRRVHQKCKVFYTPEPEILEDVKKTLGDLWPKDKQDSEIKFAKGKGDKECGNTGYFGRIGIFEVMPITEKIEKLVLTRAASGDIEKEAIKEGMITMKQDGYLKVFEGITTVEEVLRVAQE